MQADREFFEQHPTAHSAAVRAVNETLGYQEDRGLISSEVADQILAPALLAYAAAMYVAAGDDRPTDSDIRISVRLALSVIYREALDAQKVQEINDLPAHAYLVPAAKVHQAAIIQRGGN